MGRAADEEKPAAASGTRPRIPGMPGWVKRGVEEVISARSSNLAIRLSIFTAADFPVMPMNG
jgi:hypothetical protein